MRSKRSESEVQVLRDEVKGFKKRLTNSKAICSLYIYISTISHARYIKIRNGTYGKTIISIVPSYTGKNNTCCLLLALLLELHTHNNTDGNNL